jgi:acetolactate synthase I/II/III large subunit
MQTPPASLRELVDRYLDTRLSRRGFLRGLSRWGFSVAAAASVLDSLAPLAHAARAEAAALGDAPRATRLAEGTGGELLVEQLRAAGVRFVFNCNSSGTYPIFDALLDRSDMQVIQAVQEGQMVSIAEGYALGSGTVAFTLNGSVGFPNTLNNMYNAWKDRTPLVIASQREPTGLQGGRDAFEEWDDYLGAAASFTRWRWSVDQARRVPEITRRAFTIAATAPAGPVALAFPRDVLAARGVRAAIVDRERFLLRPKLAPAPRAVEAAAEALVEARSPLLVVGPEVTRSRAQHAVARLAERLSLPVAEGEMLFADFPTDHPLFVGDYRWGMAYPEKVDLIVNLGAKMPSEDGAVPGGARVVHVSTDPEEIGRVVPTDIGIVGDAKETARDLLQAVQSVAVRARLDAIRDARRVPTKAYTDKVRARREEAARARWDARPLSWERVAGELDRMLESDAIIVPELGQISWLGFPENSALVQFSFAPGKKARIGRTTGSALGWGVGAALGVKLAQPDRQVVALQGDGGFLFAQAESLWTMARYEVPVLVVIFNNRSYNGPRNKILREKGRQAETGRDMICYLGDPDVDFAKVAAGFGVKGETVQAAEEVRPALERAIACTREGRPYLIDAVVGRTGLGADSTWYPRYSVAAARTRPV